MVYAVGTQASVASFGPGIIEKKKVLLIKNAVKMSNVAAAYVVRTILNSQRRLFLPTFPPPGNTDPAPKK